MTAAAAGVPPVSNSVPIAMVFPIPASAATVRHALASRLFIKIGFPLGFITLITWNVLMLAIMIVNMPKNDFGRTFLSAVAFVHGEGMYAMNESIPWAVGGTEICLWNLNPPHFHIVLLPLAWLPGDVALGIWTVLNFTCCYLALKLILAEARIAWTPVSRRLGLLGLLAFIGTGMALLTGHMAFLLFLLLTVAWRDARRGRWNRSAVALALALSVKPFLLMLFPYYVWRRQWRAVVALLATVAVCFLAGFIIFGVENNRSWIARLSVAESWSWLPMNASLMSLLTRSFTTNHCYASFVDLPPSTIKAIWLGLGIPLGILSLAAVAPDASERGVDRAFGLLLVAALLLSPLGWTYYLPLALGPIVMLVVTWSRDRANLPGWTWRQRLMAASLPGFCVPIFAFEIGQPIAIFTATIGCIYFWSTLLVWTALALDGFCSYRAGLLRKSAITEGARTASPWRTRAVTPSIQGLNS